MRARSVVVGEVRAQEPAEMGLIQDHEVVQAFATDGPDHPLHEGILPGRAWGDKDLANPPPLDSPRELRPVDPVSITEQVRRGRVVWKRLDDLPGGPDRRGVVRDVDVDELATVMPQDDEDEQQAEGDGRDNEEVDGDDVAEVGLQKGAPRRGVTWGRPPHVPGHRELGDVVAEKGEFGPDAPAAPSGLSRAIRWIRWRISASSFGRPTAFGLDFHRQ